MNRIKLSKFQTIILGFAAIILIGTILLMLPVSSSDNNFTPFNEALFTATSAACVTGLIVQDTGTYWSVFGQAVILSLIQIGGLGVITVAAAFCLLSGRKIGLMQRSTMQEAIAAPKVGGIVRLTWFILKGTILIELFGALLMMPVFTKDHGLKGIWIAFFHSISAFCNAGFDILGSENGRYPSLTDYTGDIVINTVIMLLIILGGLGFLTWEDIYIHKFRIQNYKMQTKVILVTSFLLIIIPAVIFYFIEFQELSVRDRILASLFQSVTTRTAGYNTVNLDDMTDVGKAIMSILMLIGGSPGSTAGGMKTTTIAVLAANAIAIFNRKSQPHYFGRRIEDEFVKNASTIMVMYITLCMGGALIISVVENLPLGDCIYETASAVGTVGLTLGLTPDLGMCSKIILIILMYLGRVGGLTIIYAALSPKKNSSNKLPKEKITVG